MQVQGKRLETVEWDDLAVLIDQKVAESATLEYKAELPASNDGGKKELLADVSAMANSSGGVILYGVSEARDADGGKTDLPEAIVALPGTNPAQEQQRLDQIIRSGLDPPLARILVRPIFNADRSSYVLAVGVPSSLLAPHAVVTATTMPFWRRPGSRRYALRTSELRRAFLERGAWEDEVEEFRLRRITLLRSTPPRHPVGKVSDEPAFLLHVLPLGRLRDWIDLIPHWESLKNKLTFGQSLHQGRVNFEGILRTGWEELATRFVQWFRFGGVEAFSATLGGVSERRMDHKPTLDVARPTILAVEHALRAMEICDSIFGVGPPYAVLLSILNVRDRQPEMFRELRATFPSDDPQHDFTEDDLIFPAVFFEAAPTEVEAVATAMRPVLDAFWQAGGIGRCRMYLKDGTWRGRTFGSWDSLL